MDWKAFTGTFILPIETPRFLTSQDKTVKDLAVDETYKININKDIDILGGVELKTKVNYLQQFIDMY